MMNKIVFLSFFLTVQIIFSQQSEIFKLKKYRIAVLNDSIQETSGLHFFDGKLYTFNDSGNAAELYEINKKSGKILKTLKINAKNTDWEALTGDGENFYIGDFGSNTGTRKDLKIYKVPFQNASLENDAVKVIPFYYPEQNDFASRSLNTDFDLESMIYLNGKIHIFTKEWASKSTTHYTLNPENSDNQAVQKIESYKTGCMLTDAYYFDNKLYTVGYTKKTEVFLNIFSETEPGIFFQEVPRQFYLGTAFSVGQIEGIAVDETGIYLSAERFRSPVGGTKPFFYFIPKEKLKL